MKETYALYCILSWASLFVPSEGFSLNSPPQPAPGHTYLVDSVAAVDFDPQEYYSSNGPLRRPLLVEGVLTVEQCEECCDVILANANEIRVDLQEQTHAAPPKSKKKAKYKSAPTSTQLYQCTLEQAIEIIMSQSDSRKSYLTFCEGLLEDEDQAESFSEVRQVLQDAKESVFDDNDWFTFFPESTEPTDAVILAGAGATSTLHRDPFEWTGTSLCLEGTKIWRFVEPCFGNDDANNDDGEKSQPSLEKVLAIDKALKSYRLDSMAWDEESVALSAGWQSDFSMYKQRKHHLIPSARDLVEMEEEERRSKIENTATSLDLLQPDVPYLKKIKIHTAIQKPGDLLLIPAHWWHQTYGLEPSLAIASQRCGNGDAEMVFQHMLTHVGKEAEIEFPSAESILKELDDPLEAVEAVFEELCKPLLEAE